MASSVEERAKFMEDGALPPAALHRRPAAAAGSPGLGLPSNARFRSLASLLPLASVGAKPDRLAAVGGLPGAQ